MHRFCAVRVGGMIACLVLAAGAQAGVDAVSESTPRRERGFSRFDFSHLGSAERAIPQCIKAPAADAPLDVGPVGVWEYDLGEYPNLACFSAEQPPSLEMQRAVNQFMERFLDRYNLGSRWTGTAGSPRTLTWSFAPDGLNIPNGVGEPAAPSSLFATMDSKFGGIANRAVWIAQFQACFDRWAALTGLSYTFVSNAGNPWDDGAVWGSTGSNVSGQVRGDVRISMKPIDGVNNVLAYNSFPQGGDMVMDAAESWAQGAPSYLFMRNIVIHEHGHGIGLAHVCPVNGNRLMEPFLSTSFDGPQQDDLRGAVAHYGDAYESNNIVGTATPIGAIANGVTLNPSTVPAPNILNGALTAISVDGDVDFYSVTAASPVLATITVAPLGTNYQSYTQNSTTGACNTGVNNTNAATQADLTLDVLTSGGTTMRASPGAAIGLNEQLTAVLLSGNGRIIRVGENGAVAGTQMYTLTVTGTSVPSIAASDSTFSDRVDVSWTAITGAASYQVLRNSINDLASATVVGTPATNAFSDTSAVGGVTYFYWANAVFGAEAILIAGPDQGTRQLSGPANDACANATVVTGGSVAGTLVGATNDGTSSCGTTSGNADVWYSFTAGGCPGRLTLSTCGTHDAGGVDTGIDTVLAVFDACGGAELSCNDDAFPACSNDSGNVRDSLVNLDLSANQSVRIRVSKFGTTAVGPFTLNVAFAPVNDLCANAIAVVSGASTSFCNANANTDGPTETLCNFFSNNTITGDLWYTYTPVSSGRFTVTTCGTASFDTKIAIYSSACPGAPDTAIACSDDNCSTQTTVSAIGVAGQTYRIRLGGFDGATGSGTFLVYCPADFNQNGVVSVQDIFDFLSGYFSNAPGADINGVGGISVQDIFDYLAAYFSGC